MWYKEWIRSVLETKIYTAAGIHSNSVFPISFPLLVKFHIAYFYKTSHEKGDDLKYSNNSSFQLATSFLYHFLSSLNCKTNSERCHVRYLFFWCTLKLNSPIGRWLVSHFYGRTPMKMIDQIFPPHLSEPLHEK